MNYKLSFRRHERLTGRPCVGYPHPSVDIKINGQVVGYIQAPNWTSKENVWKLKFAVIKANILEDKNPNCTWKWITLKWNYDDEAGARAGVEKVMPIIMNRYKLHHFEKE